MLLDGLRSLAAKHEIVNGVRGRGLLVGVEFHEASGLMMKAVPRWAREGLYANVVCTLLLRDHRVLTQPCSLRENVLRAEPPLTVEVHEIERFIDAVDRTLRACRSHRSALGSAFRKRILGRDL